MFKCKVCGVELPYGTTECTNCLIHLEPPAKFKEGDVVKLVLKDRGYVYYNYVIGSYFNHDIKVRMYRLNERMAMHVYREDWLEPVSDEEIERINKSGLLRPGKRGGFEWRL